MEYCAYPISRRYLGYEARMRKLARRLQWLRRHLVLVLLALCALIAAFCCFLGQIGTFTAPLRCSDCVYGEKQIVSCRAFLAKPEYEYATAEGAWAGEFPSTPGTYRIRAVTRDGFGRPRYTPEQTFVLSPRPVSVDFADNSYIYGEMCQFWAMEQLRCAGLAKGDVLADTTLEISMDAGRNVTVRIQGLRIENADGRDVTACYLVSCKDGHFAVQPRPITVTVENEEKLYDGTDWAGGRWQLDGTLALGDNLSCTIDPLPAQAGTYDIQPAVSVQDAAGEDVTAFYTITIHSGTLTVHPRPLTISTGSACRVYNDKELTENSWEFVSGEILDGHRLQVKVTGSCRAVGSALNTATVQLFDRENEDVTENYAITIQYGKLEIQPIELVIRTDGAEKIYDGLPIEAGGELVSGHVLKHHRLKITPTPFGPDAGSYQNSLHAAVYDSRGKDVTADGYHITIECGTLQIKRRPMTFESGSATKYYDGEPLTHEECWRVSGTFASGGGNQFLTGVAYSGSQTEVGSSPNTFEVTISVPGQPPTTHNYDITYIYGTLTVLPSEEPETYPKADIDSSYSDNTDLGISNSSFDTTVAIVTGIEGFPSMKHIYLRQQSYGDYTTQGWRGAEPAPGFENEASPLLWLGESRYEQGAGAAVIHLERLKGCPVLMPCFTVNSPGNAFTNGDDRYFGTSPAELDITLYPDTDLAALRQNCCLSGWYSDLEYAYRTYAYAWYLDIPASTREGLAIWAENCGLQKDSETLIEDIRIAVMCAGRYDANTPNYPEGEDDVLYFLNVARAGICQQFASTATLVYRLFGIPARYTVGFSASARNGEKVEVTEEDAHAWTEIYLDGLGWIPVDATPGDGGGMGEILPAKAIGYQASKIYDGKALNVSNIHSCVLEEGFLLYGHSIEAVYKPVDDLVAPGDYELPIASYRIVDEAGNDVTAQYDVSFLPGKLSILKRPITITTASAEKSYDGMPLRSPHYWISSGTLAPGDYLELKLPTQRTEQGSTKNEPASVRILRNVNGKTIDVTDYYRIECIYGSLTVT